MASARAPETSADSDVCTGETSKETLQRPLIVRTQLNQCNEAVEFRKIGFGQCGLVFGRPDRGFVIKIARPRFHDALWSDFVTHFHIYKAFEEQNGLEFRIPAVYSYVNKANSTWWDAHRSLFSEHDNFPMPSMALITERISPLPKIASEALVAQYCPKHLQSAVMADPNNRDCLARIYLGKRRLADAPLAPNFTLRNFNLCVDQMLELDLPVHDYAVAMGEALAVIHWGANTDGYDIEYVLGREATLPYVKDISTMLGLTPELVAAMPPHIDLDALIEASFNARQTRLWILDFNLCNRWVDHIGWEYPTELVDQLVLAFFENDPYYPLPMMEEECDRTLWKEFSEAYIRKSGEVLGSSSKDTRLVGLPDMFIKGCIAREVKKLEAGLGHGHRDLKG